MLLAVELFGDEEQGGFFHTPADGEHLVNRKKELDDHPTPSGNSMLAYVLLRLARIYGDDDLERQAVGVFRLAARLLPQAPSAFGHLLCVEIVDEVLVSHEAIAARLGRARELEHRARAGRPHSHRDAGLAAERPDVGVDGRPAVYVCERFVCRAPVTEPAALPQ